MPSTPEPYSTRTRARTPPTPLHGPQHDTYEPYSPRRSARTAARRNPYGSSDANRATTTPPPTTTKRAHFAAPATQQLSSPPASPRHHKTPRHSRSAAVKVANSLSDSDNTTGRRVAASHNLDSTNMLPTPSKTPQTQKQKNESILRSTARILHFTPAPGPVEQPCRIEFELHSSDEEMAGSKKNKNKNKNKKAIPIYTDPNARVPERDEREINPFLGPAAAGVSMSSRKKRGEEEEEEEMEERVRRNEGMFYVFRGKKIFRPYTSISDGDNDDEIPASTQRTLRRQAGATATRPLTRSLVRPRLLFPSAAHQRAREDDLDLDVEEALTDIEMAVGEEGVRTPPSMMVVARGKEGSGVGEAGPEIRIYEDDAFGRGDDLQNNVAGSARTTMSPAAAAKGRKKKAGGGVASPFDSWPRTKAGRKRTGEEVVAEGTKRTRSGGTGTGRGI